MIYHQYCKLSAHLSKENWIDISIDSGLMVSDPPADVNTLCWLHQRMRPSNVYNLKVQFVRENVGTDSCHVRYQKERQILY